VLDGSVSLSDPDATSQAQSVEVSGGTLSVAGTLEASELALSGGTLGGAGTVSASDSFDWTSGSMSGSGATELTDTASGSIHPATGSMVTMNQRTLRNEGTLDLDSGRVEIGLGGVIDNAGTLTVDAETGAPGLPYWQQPGLYDAYWGDRARLRNAGTLRKSHGTGSTTLGPQVDNQGTIDAQTGQMLFGGGGYGEQTGSWSASGDGSSLVFGGGAFSLNRPSGQLIFSSATATADSLDSAGEDVSVLGGSVSVTDTNATSTAGSVMIDSDGSFSVAGTLNTTDLTMTGGTLGGSGTVSVTGNLDWTHGSMTGPGVTDLAQNASGSIHPPTGSIVTLCQRTLQSAGALGFLSGRVELCQGATIDNHGTATVDTEDGAPGLPSWQQPGLYDAFQGARGRFNNSGTTRKGQGSGTTLIGPQFHNHGTAEADSGKLVFTGGGIPGAGVPEFPECPFQPQIQDGTWAAASGAEIDFSAGCYKLGGDTQISGNVSITGAYLTAPDIQESATSTLSITDGKLQLSDPDTTSHVQHLNMSGTGTLTGEGTIAIGEDCSLIGGIMSGPGTTIISPAASCIIDPGTNGTLTLAQRRLTNQGTMTWTSGSVSGSRGAIIENLGTLHANSESGTGMYATSGGMTPLLLNRGTLKKSSGTGTTEIDWIVSRKGTILINTGDLHLGGSFNTRLTQLENGQGGTDPPETPEDILMPGGEPIGTPSPGGDDTIRDVPGGMPTAEDIFFRLAGEGTDVTPDDYDGISAELPDGQGRVGIRPESGSGDPAVDVKIPSVPDVRKIHFGT
jgi:hypothetical protein